MNDTSKGVLAILVCCTIWGLSPLFYKELAHVAPQTVLAHRTLWSLLFLGAVLMGQGRFAHATRLISAHPIAVFGAALMISCNWYLYIWAVGVGRTVEASLGYYIFPLVAVLLGRLVLGERLAMLQWAAVGLATLAVGVLTYGLGMVPVVSVFLAMTFGTYGLIKRRLEAGPVVSVTAEAMVLAPLAVIWLWYVGGPYGVVDASTLMFLCLSGPMTALPLMLFSYGSRRVTLATVGVLQYINPTLQFVCAVLVFSEPFSQWHAIAFTLIWLGVALYCAWAAAQDRSARRAVIAASGPLNT